MKIKEVELATGITKQNIRYYEKQGLLNPKRDKENDYREYSEEDVRILKIIKLFRKLDMPLEEIRKLLQEETKLAEAVALQKERLEKEKERLSAALDFCDKIEEKEIAGLDVDKYLEEMETEERNGAVFAEWFADFKKVVAAEAEREFFFMPDNRCKNKAEFTEALFQYANENNLNLVITKESMTPEFTIDGVEYTAYRYFARMGVVVHCEMKHPEDAVPEGMSRKKYLKMQKVWNICLPIGMLALLLCLMFIGKASPKDILETAIGIVLTIVPITTMMYFFKGMH